MSLTLPYPDMVFVPLDILTAQELNEIVSNVEYISDQFPIAAANLASNAVTTAKISDEAVTADKIDFTNFIQTGSANVAYQANTTGGGFTEVTFPVAFSSIPKVFAQDLLANGYVSSLSVSNVTTTGFRLLARTTGADAGTANVNWIAFLL